MLKKIFFFFVYFLSLFSFSNGEETGSSSDSFSSASKKKLRFFNLDLHISVIADIKTIFESLGHEVVNWSISGHTWVFGKERDYVEVVNENTWWNLNQEMCDQFYEKYKGYLSQFDAFIVTHTPSFSLLYEKLNKPIIVVNTTRYEQPFTLYPDKWKWLNDYLNKGVEDGKIIIVSNNKGDQQYIKHYTGIENEHIPSLCLYTNAHYTGKKESFIFKCPFLNVIKRFISPESLIGNSELPGPYAWQDLYDFKGFVHIPYQISTMTLFELYSANVPLFFPSKQFLRDLLFQAPQWVLSQLSFFKIYESFFPTTKGDPNNLNDPDIVNFWIDSCDFYDEENMPYVQYFDSFLHLEHLLKTTDCAAISQKMREYNEKRKQRVLEKWKAILQKLTASEPRP